MSKIIPSNPSTIDADQLNQQNQDLNPHFECRICLENSLPLIIACSCTGTVKYVHEECLKQWANEVIKKKLKQQQEEGDQQIIQSIQCELCKQNIELKVDWATIKLSFQEAKMRNEDYFWSIFFINVFISLICLGCILFALVTMIMVLVKNPTVDYEKFTNEPLLSWGTLSIALTSGMIFLFKSLKDLHSMFVRQEFQINGVVAKEMIGEKKEKITQLQSNFDNLRSMSDFKIQLEGFNPNLNKAVCSNNKKTSGPLESESETNHEIIVPNRSSLGLKHFKKLPPLSKLVPSG